MADCDSTQREAKPDTNYIERQPWSSLMQSTVAQGCLPSALPSTPAYIYCQATPTWMSAKARSASSCFLASRARCSWAC